MIKQLLELAREKLSRPGAWTATLTQWNDENERKQEDVLALYDRAIASGRAANAQSDS